MTESEVQQKIQIEGPFHNCILMRNNSGAFTDSTGRIVRYGLGNISKKQNDEIKSSDLIGIKKIIITPSMIGQTVGVFVAVEVKPDDYKPNLNKKREQAQMKFIEWVKSMGGIAGLCKNVEEFKELIK